MSTNHTENYSLCQWEAEDQVLRTDFNADNAKIDAELAELRRMTELSAYYIGQLGTFCKLNHAFPPRFSYRGFIWDGFVADQGPVLTGGVISKDGILILSGAGNTGSWEAQQGLTTEGWTRGRLWIHASGGTVVPTIGGAVLSKPMINPVYEYDQPGHGCTEYCYEFSSDDGLPKYGISVKIHLDLTVGSGGQLKVHDFSALFF